METREKLISFWVETEVYEFYIEPDDFIVAEGKLKSNSVYHVVESRCKANKAFDLFRWHVKVLKSDLLTALRRDPSQRIIPIVWLPRNKK